MSSPGEKISKGHINTWNIWNYRINKEVIAQIYRQNFPELLTGIFPPKYTHTSAPLPCLDVQYLSQVLLQCIIDKGQSKRPTLTLKPELKKHTQALEPQPVKEIHSEPENRAKRLKRDSETEFGPRVKSSPDQLNMKPNNHWAGSQPNPEHEI